MNTRVWPAVGPASLPRPEWSGERSSHGRAPRCPPVHARDGEAPRFEAPAGLSVDLVTAREAAGEGAAGILFLPDGRSTGGRIELAADGRRRALVVDWLTGLVRLERP